MRHAIQVWLTLSLFSIVMLCLGYSLGGRLGMFSTFVVTIVFAAFYFLQNENEKFRGLKIRQLQGNDPWHVLPTTSELSSILHTDVPEVFVFENESAYCFSYISAWSEKRIALSSGLLNHLAQDELRSLLAFEICRLKMTDTPTAHIPGIFSDLLHRIGQFLDWVWPVNWVMPQKKPLRIFTWLVFPLVWLGIRLNSPNSLYYKIDRKTVELAGDAQTWAQALQKLENHSRCQPLAVSPTMAHLFTVNPLNGSGFKQNLDTHPRFENRIRQLVGQFPI